MSSHETQRVLRRLRELALEHAGMSLDQFADDALRHKIAGEVKRAGGLLRYAALLEVDRKAMQRFVEQLCTHETRLFRHPSQFEYLRTDYLPWLRKRSAHVVNAWSAACSTGEEAASLAVALAQVYQLDGAFRVFASDISAHVVERARALRWPLAAAEHVPRELLSKYFLRGIGAESGYMRLAPQLAAAIDFDIFNLVHSPLPGRRFDIIMCRNVFIYFPTMVRQHVARRLLSALTPEGVLFTGPSEGLTQHVTDAEMVAPHVYRRRPTP